MMQVGKSAGKVFSFLRKFLALAPRTHGVREVAGHGDDDPSDKPIRGPLTARIFDISDDMEEQMMNAATFVFAGHDTTANTMTWLLFELAKNKEIQTRLQAEVDELFGRLEGKPLQYDHLFSTPYLTRCLTESMRLWPVVPNGTFRQLKHDDYVHGPGGKRVELKKGTYVQVPNWMRHRSAELWGKDAHKFNPDRDWQEYELWDDKVFRGFNPSSERFSPFTYGPRDCMGKNFAQMEMRVIMLHLLHCFDFSLGKITAGYRPDDFLGVNRATLGPQDIGEDPNKPAKLGMYFKITPRKAVAKF